MVTLHQLRTFLAVARHDTLTQAARELGASQPTISLQIKTLSRFLGSELIARSAHGVHLTPAGEAVRRYALEVLDGLKALQQEVQALTGGESGSFALGASATTGGYVLPTILSRFRSRFPHVDVKLYVDNPERLFRDLLAGALDVVFSVGVRTPSGVTVEPICDEEMVLILSPRHPLARRRKVAAHELSAEPLVTSLPGVPFRELVEKKLREIGVQPRVAAEARHPEAMKKLVENGMGYSLLFRPSVADEIKQRRLVALRVEGSPIMGQLVMALRAGSVVTPLVSRFIEFVRAELSPRRPQQARAVKKTSSGVGDSAR